MRSSFALLIFAIALGTLGAGFSPCSAQTNFLRGDCNGDGSLNLADAIQLLGVLFSGDPAPSCTDACDFNDDGTNNIADAISGLGYLFSGDPDLPPPFLVCGVDPTADSLACPDFPVCPQGQAEICNSGVDEDLDGAIDCMDSDCFTDPACAVSHSVDIQPIWDANCLFCHSPPMPPMNLDLNPGPAYSLLIDIESNECFVFDRVEPDGVRGAHARPRAAIAALAWRSTYLATMSSSRFTWSPTRVVPRVVTVSVCGITAIENESTLTSATVRLIPSTAIDPFSQT